MHSFPGCVDYTVQKSFLYYRPFISNCVHLYELEYFSPHMILLQKQEESRASDIVLWFVFYLSINYAWNSERKLYSLYSQEYWNIRKYELNPLQVKIAGQSFRKHLIYLTAYSLIFSPLNLLVIKQNHMLKLSDSNPSSCMNSSPSNLSGLRVTD